MLKKLLKYEFKSIFKFLFVFYSLALIFAVMTRIFFNIEDSFIMGIIGQICTGGTISMVFSILINNLMRLWVKFKSNFYGDESYLTHTLPIDKKTLYLSKAISSVVSLFVSLCVIVVILAIAYYSKENLEMIKNILLPIANLFDSTAIKMIFAFLFVFFLEFANLLQAGYSGIILGHKMNNRKSVFSVIYGFCVYMITQIFALIMLFVFALFNSDMMNLFYTTESINIDMIKIIIYLAILIYLVSLIAIYLVNVKLLERGVNVD